MNIKITYNWLLEYLETDATPFELQKYLSLCGPSIERVDKVGDDYVMDIEVTSNRVDMASVFGIAQEAQAILPQFGKKAQLKFNPFQTYVFSSLNHQPSVDDLPLQVELVDQSLATRLTGIIVRDIKIGESPSFIKERLEACDIRSLNNVIDISNYLMLSLGQPTHTFDYDKIVGAKMLIRESKKGEKVVTLDGKTITLPGGDIVIEDGYGQITDLAGIMGGKKSEITETTKNVLLFVETYDQKKIRRTSMSTGQRTMAATYFEKGLDEERVEPTVIYGTQLLEKYANGKQASQIYDIYLHPYTPKTIDVRSEDITRVIGVEIDLQTIKTILQNLGFVVETQNNFLHITIPSWRKDDINIKEDIAEEVARVYGYHNLPNAISPMIYIKQPREIEKLFSLQTKIKYFLKHLGLYEQMNYSMISEELMQKLDLTEEKHLKLANTISEEIKYMRVSLLPSLTKNIKDNEGKKDILKFFEIAKVYHPQPHELPQEQYKLSIATNTDFFDLKGIFEALMRELHIEEYSFNSSEDKRLTKVAEISIHGDKVGVIGQLKRSYKESLGINSEVFLLEVDFSRLIQQYHILPAYRQINPYAVIKLDLTFQPKNAMNYNEITQLSRNESPLLQNIEVVDRYKDNITVRFYFSSTEKNLTEEEAKTELAKIKSRIS